MREPGAHRGGRCFVETAVVEVVRERHHPDQRGRECGGDGAPVREQRAGLRSAECFHTRPEHRQSRRRDDERQDAKEHIACVGGGLHQAIGVRLFALLDRSGRPEVRKADRDERRKDPRPRQIDMPRPRLLPKSALAENPAEDTRDGQRGRQDRHQDEEVEQEIAEVQRAHRPGIARQDPELRAQIVAVLAKVPDRRRLGIDLGSGNNTRRYHRLVLGDQ
jgi:hypothetical protein